MGGGSSGELAWKGKSVSLGKEVVWNADGKAATFVGQYMMSCHLAENVFPATGDS